MGPGSGEGRQSNHIRSVAWLFLGDAPRPPLPPPSIPGCRVTGAPGSPWPLAFAVNLGLAAWRRAERVWLELPPASLPAAARLLGAPPGALGLDWSGGGAAPVRLEPLPDFHLIPAGEDVPPLGGWHFRLEAPLVPAASPILALVESAQASLPAAAGAPLFLLGLACLPVPRPGVTGVWGPLAVHQLLDPRREGAPALRAGEAALLRRYGGFLEALRSMPAARARELTA